MRTDEELIKKGKRTLLLELLDQGADSLNELGNTAKFIAGHSILSEVKAHQETQYVLKGLREIIDIYIEADALLKEVELTEADKQNAESIVRLEDRRKAR